MGREKRGGTPGDRRLINIAEDLTELLKDKFSIISELLPYGIDRGGIFLKDAAVLSGMGTIGENNLLITAEYGPCLRLRALILDTELVATGPTYFSPCDACDMPCWQACPQRAFSHGSYIRVKCMNQMKLDEAKKELFQDSVTEEPPKAPIKYCRACELACPLGR